MIHAQKSKWDMEDNTYVDIKSDYGLSAIICWANEVILLLNFLLSVFLACTNLSPRTQHMTTGGNVNNIGYNNFDMENRSIHQDVE